MSIKNKHNHKRFYPVTIIFSVTAKKGAEKEVEKWAHEITHAAVKFDGNLGGNWIKPSGSGRDFTVIYKFVDSDDAHRWISSDIRKRFLKKGEELFEQREPEKLQEVTGLETWFTLPGHASITPPKRWKMVLTTMVGIYPIGLVYQAYLVQYMKGVPLLLRPIVLSLILTPILTYLIMPQLTKLMRKWLYPNS